MSEKILDKKVFGSRFSECLGASKETISTVAEKVSLKPSTISRYANGLMAPKIPTLYMLSDIFKVNPLWLMGYDEPKFSDGAIKPAKQAKPSNVLPLSPSLSEDALQVAQDYSALDKPGQRVVKVVIADQQSRVKEEKKKKRTKKYEESEFEGQETGRVIPRYFTPSSAGFASPAFGDDFEYLEVGGDVPPYADFAVDIDGDSMEPYIMNGSTVYVNRDPLQNADVGIFFCDGDMLCKQYYRDEWGNVWLLSLNRDRAEADRFIEAESDVPLVCYGRVILPHPLRLAVPENELL